MRRRIVVADCETDPFKRRRIPIPFVWGFYDGENYRQFPETPDGCDTCTEDFIAFLKTQYVICYAHNGGRFDWHFILPHANPYDDLMIINGRIARMMVGDCECRDSYNILPVPLSAYKKDNFDYALMEKEQRTKSKNWKKISEYLQHDCIYLHELVSKFVDSYGLQITQASAAMRQWQKLSKVKAPHTDKVFYDELAPYYYGGRVQCFESGVIDTKFSVYDINSAYPYAMLFNHPFSKEYIHVDRYICDADFYNVRCISRGAFPYRGVGGIGNANFGLHFPDDNEIRDYTISKWEYVAALETKTITNVTVLESILFEEHINFDSYINHFYDLRLKAKAENNTAMDLFCKLLLNGLYGKFASNPENYNNYMLVPMDIISGLAVDGWDFAGEFGPWALASAPLTDEQQRYYNIAVSASITGFVRAMLWRAICSSKRVLYCDTDSLAVCKKGNDIEIGNALGNWKHEGDFDRAGIAGKKLYVFRGTDKGKKRQYKFASKGAKLSLSQLWKVARGKNVMYEFDAPTFSPQKAPSFTTREIKFTA